MSREITPHYRGNSSGWKSLMRNSRGIFVAEGTTVPSDAATGFAPGCLFIHTDGTAGSQFYINEGSKTSADFNPVAATGAGSFSSITFAAAGDIIAPANTAAALEITNGSATVLGVDTRNTVTGANAVTITSPAATIATAASALRRSALDLGASTLTLTGTNTVTSLHGLQLYCGAVTLTDASAGTVSVASTVFVSKVPAAGGSLTITASRMIATEVTDCYLTNAGVWTDTASAGKGKEKLVDAERAFFTEIFGKIRPRAWSYREDFHGNDFNRKRLGIVAEELPDELAPPGEEKAGGIAAGVLSSFALGALSFLWKDVQVLTHQVFQLEEALAARLTDLEALKARVAALEKPGNSENKPS